MMEDNTSRMREIVRKIEMLDTRMNKLASQLTRKIDEDNVTDELLRTLSSPIEELEWRVSCIERNIEELEEY